MQGVHQVMCCQRCGKPNPPYSANYNRAVCRQCGRAAMERRRINQAAAKKSARTVGNLSSLRRRGKSAT